MLASGSLWLVGGSLTSHKDGVILEPKKTDEN